MEHTVDFKVGESVFIPSIFSSNNDFQAIVLSVGRKYVTLVHQEFHNTEDEKEMAFKVDKITYKTDGAKGYIRTVYQNEAQYLEIQAEEKRHNERVRILKTTNWANLKKDQIEQILKIIQA